MWPVTQRHFRPSPGPCCASVPSAASLRCQSHRMRFKQTRRAAGLRSGLRKAISALKQSMAPCSDSPQNGRFRFTARSLPHPSTDGESSGIVESAQRM
jgi:hypothetical protein